MSLSSLFDRCAADPRGPVALHLAQHLQPVEGQGAPFFPPTFAMDEKYNIDTLADGTQVALVDSVGSQANRLEPVFLQPELQTLVPQVTIHYGDESQGTAGSVSLLEAGHRLGDAVIRCTELADEAHNAFLALKRGNAEPIARVAPTSLLFGAWDSRDTGVKIPRLLQSVIRAWRVSRLTRSAQFVPALDYESLDVIGDEASMKKAEKSALSERGFLHVPSTRDPGGIVAEGPILRDLTLNLVQLRRLGGTDDANTTALRRYVLGLALVAATEPPDPFLRQGCLLVPDPEHAVTWMEVRRDGTRHPISLDRDAVLPWARAAAEAFGVGNSRELTFDSKRAKSDMAKRKQS